jgi:hypothetical protein
MDGGAYAVVDNSQKPGTGNRKRGAENLGTPVTGEECRVQNAEYATIRAAGRDEGRGTRDEETAKTADGGRDSPLVARCSRLVARGSFHRRDRPPGRVNSERRDGIISREPSKAGCRHGAVGEASWAPPPETTARPAPCPAWEISIIPPNSMGLTSVWRLGCARTARYNGGDEWGGRTGRQRGTFFRFPPRQAGRPQNGQEC